MNSRTKTAVFYLLRLVFRAAGCLVAALCATIVLSRTFGGLFDAVPLRLVTWLVRTCSPETIIDGETAYDVRMGDSMVFYGVLLFALFWYVSTRLRKQGTPRS